MEVSLALLTLPQPFPQDKSQRFYHRTPLTPALSQPSTSTHMHIHGCNEELQHRRTISCCLTHTHTCSYLWCCSPGAHKELAEHTTRGCTLHLPTASIPPTITLLTPVPHTISSVVSPSVPTVTPLSPHPPASTVAHTQPSCGPLEQPQPAGQTQAVRDHLLPAQSTSSTTDPGPACPAMLLPGLAHPGAVHRSAWVTVKPQRPLIRPGQCSGQWELFLSLMTGPEHCQELGLGALLLPSARDASCEELAVVSHGSRQMEQGGNSREGIC